MKKYNQGIACYPTKFKGYVVSPTKICLQYEDVQLKMRPLEAGVDDLPKLGTGHRYIPVSSETQEVKILANGHQMPELEAMLSNVIDAYAQYARYHKETYRITYGKDLIDSLLLLQAKLNNLITKINDR